VKGGATGERKGDAPILVVQKSKSCGQEKPEPCFSKQQKKRGGKKNVLTKVFQHQSAQPKKTCLGKGLGGGSGKKKQLLCRPSAGRDEGGQKMGEKRAREDNPTSYRKMQMQKGTEAEKRRTRGGGGGGSKSGGEGVPG